MHKSTLYTDAIGLH